MYKESGLFPTSLLSYTDIHMHKSALISNRHTLTCGHLTDLNPLKRVPDTRAVKFSPQLTRETLKGSLRRQGDEDSSLDTPNPNCPLDPSPNA